MSTLSISSAEYDQNESPGGCCRVDSWSSSTSVTVRVLDGGVADYYESFFHHEVHELEYYDRTGEALSPWVDVSRTRAGMAGNAPSHIRVFVRVCMSCMQTNPCPVFSVGSSRTGAPRKHLRWYAGAFMNGVSGSWVLGQWVAGLEWAVRDDDG